jgi:hypothetical protein
VVFFTDGVLAHGPDPVEDPVRRLVRDFTHAHQLAGSLGVLDELLRPTEDEACVVTAEVVSEFAPAP